MWNPDDRISLTPTGRFVLSLPSSAEYEEEPDTAPQLDHGGRESRQGYKPTDSGRRAVRALQQAAAAIEALPYALDPRRGYISPMDALFPEEAAICSDLPHRTPATSQRPTPPNLCTVCDIASIYPGGPSCFDERCPNRLYLPADQPSKEEKARFYREDAGARNASDGRGDLS